STTSSEPQTANVGPKTDTPEAVESNADKTIAEPNTANNEPRPATPTKVRSEKIAEPQEITSEAPNVKLDNPSPTSAEHQKGQPQVAAVESKNERPEDPKTVTKAITEEAGNQPTGEEAETEYAVGESQVQVAEPALKTEIKKPDALKKIQLDMASKRVSALSISSLKAKKEHQLSKKEEAIDESQLPKEDFTEEEMQKHWAYFVEKIDGHGRKILASSLTTDVPKMFDDTTIWIELPNDTMKKEVEREQYDLINHLKQELNNHFISLRITVNEETAKKFAFTPEEKYQKLREKNPAIDLLRKTFDLDL
ncbi:MAG: hypothetical protein WA913_11355, partial [Pricia sp.]